MARPEAVTLSQKEYAGNAGAGTFDHRPRSVRLPRAILLAYGQGSRPEPFSPCVGVNEESVEVLVCRQGMRLERNAAFDRLDPH